MFEQIKLSFENSGLEPVIDTATVETHYGKHHAAYTKTFNELVEKAGLQGKSAEEILSGLDSVADEALRTGLRNQGGGYLNHNIYFEQLKPEAQAKKAPEGALLAQIEKQFGSVDKLKEELNALSASQFGSGWGWLGKKSDGSLVTYKTANQDNCYSLKLDSTPILALDVWEHAYYLKYKNLRADYLKALWNIIDWSVAEERYK
ncbi:MAG: superoxide dismutase [Lachnospiraceae bacterium]|nr:superoxide dismutase [Lachnospiraceae bacterium]